MTAAVVAAAAPAHALERFRARPSTVVSLLFVGWVLIAAVAPGLLTDQSPTQFKLADSLRPPSFTHVFGTDSLGRDLLVRVIYGARQSLGIGLGATGLAIVIAILVGFLAALAGGVVDAVINRLLEVAFAFPVLLVALLFISVRGPSVQTEIIAVGIGSAPGYARMVRGQVLKVKQAAYIEAAGALGHSRFAVLRRHLFPNAIRALVAVMTLGVGQSIVWASGLSFLGLGVAPPSSEWGALLDAGREYITTSWWLEILPGLVIVLVALAVTSLGRTLQHKLEGAAR